MTIGFNVPCDDQLWKTCFRSFAYVSERGMSRAVMAAIVFDTRGAVQTGVCYRTNECGGVQWNGPVAPNYWPGMGQMIEFASNGGTAEGYVAGDSGPGVLVIQEWWGLNDHIKSI